MNNFRANSSTGSYLHAKNETRGYELWGGGQVADKYDTHQDTKMFALLISNHSVVAVSILNQSKCLAFGFVLAAVLQLIVDHLPTII